MLHAGLESSFKNRRFIQFPVDVLPLQDLRSDVQLARATGYGIGAE